MKNKDSVNKQLILWGNKRRVLNMILDFVKYPPEYPQFRYHHLLAYLDNLSERDGLTKRHHDFLKRILETENAKLMRDLEDIKEVK